MPSKGLATVQANQPGRLTGMGLGGVAPAGGALDSVRSAIGLNSTPATQRILRRLASRVLTGIAILAIIFVVALVGFRMLYGGKVYPAISTAGVALGGMTRDEAAQAIASRTDQLATDSVLFTFGGETFRPQLADLGVTFDTQRTLDDAFSYGRESSAVQRLQVAQGLLESDHQVPLYATIDYNVMNSWFDETDSQLGLVPHDAYLVVDGTEVTIEPEVAGTIVDRDTARNLITAAVTDLTPVHSTLPVVDWVPNVRAGDLEKIQQQVTSALSHSIDVKYGDQTWTIQPADLAPFVIQDNDKSKTGESAVSIRLDQDALASFLAEQYAGSIYLEPVNAQVGWNGAPVAVSASVDGHELRPAEFAQAVSDSFFGDHKDVTVPVNVLKPAVDSNNLGALGITTRLGRGDSNYNGSDSGRATNIGVGVGLLNGTLVAPGGQFSFNHSIGVITADKGYVEARVIEAERIGKGIGGGICQVSTTVFRAALMAGMPIDEWWPHAQRISFYERDGWGPGYDASILQPDADPFSGGDFKFSNPTDKWLLVESYVDGTYVVVNIYGPDTGWKVDVGDAEQSDPIPPDGDIEVVNNEMTAGCVVHTELPLDGLIVWFTRTVTDSSGTVLRQATFETDFKSNGNVYVVSPDQQGASPAMGGSNDGNCDFSAIPA